MALLDTLSFIVRHPLNRGRAASALLRYVKWQVGSRLVPGPVVVPWVNDSRLIVRPGETGLTGNVYCGLHEFEDMAFLLHATGEDDLFVDVGANVGSYTVLACAARGAHGVCVEPVPQTFERLQANLRINDLTGRVEALNLGLSGQSGELAFTSDENCTNHVVAGDADMAGAVRVKVMPLDAVLKGRAPNLMKIDVEGFETAVLAGAKLTLASASLRAVIMELNGSGARYGYDEGEILKTMQSHGFATYAYDPYIRKLTVMDGKNRCAGNTLFIRDVEWVAARVSLAPAFTLGEVCL